MSGSHPEPLRIALTGASGLIGSGLAARLRAAGHQVLTLVRRAPRSPSEVGWDPAAGTLDATALAGVQAVVHLAGAGIGDKRWTPAYRQLVLDSRVSGTRLLAGALAGLDAPPRVLLSGSAVGFYGDTGDQPVDESSPAGTGFLAQVCQQWEAATAPAEQAGIRVCHLRTGIVLSAAGGALAKQLPLFRAGLGGRLGSGRQYLSWVALDDELAAIEFLLTARVTGPVNLTAPNPVPQQDFARLLGRAVHRPAPWPIPAAALRLALGEFATEGVLAGQRVLPAALTSAGYRFALPDLAGALQAALG